MLVYLCKIMGVRVVQNKLGAIKALMVTMVAILIMMIFNSDKSIDKFQAKEVFLGGNKSSKEVILTAVGDIIVHSEQIVAAYNNENKSYEFDDEFQYIKKYIEESDIAYGTIEGTYSGGQLGYSGYPVFNTPESMLGALKNTGFDIINGANDHILDKDVSGYLATINNIKEAGLKYVGIKEKEEDNSFIIEKINGIKIGFTSCTFSEVNSNGERVLNDITVPTKLSNNINTFSYSNIENDMLKLKIQIDEMKDKGADFIVVGMHWGNEYSTTPSEEQRKIAKILNSYGVNLILGSHPHVIQPIETITDEATMNETLVVYSMGNFLSNQRFETMGNSLAADGVIVKIKLSKNLKGKVSIETYNYISTWVYKYKNESNKNEYVILPNEDTINSEEIKKLPKEIKSELERSLNSTQSILGK